MRSFRKKKRSALARSSDLCTKKKDSLEALEILKVSSF